VARGRQPVRRRIPAPAQKIPWGAPFTFPPPPQVTRAPLDVPRVRRTIAEFLKSHGAGYFAQSARSGALLPSRPAGPDRRVGEVLANAELERVTGGEMWFVDRAVSELVGAAAPDLPRFSLTRHDLLSTSGFLLFAVPVPLCGVTPGLNIEAVSWSVVGPSKTNTRCPDGGVWMTFYAQAAGLPQPLCPVGEVIIGFRAEDTPEALHPPIQWEGSAESEAAAEVALTAMRMTIQPDLCDRALVVLPRSERRNEEAAETRSPREVNAVSLAHSACGKASGGAWASQWHGPRQVSRPRWVWPTPKRTFWALP
jgi:hypothetical protein